MHFDLKGRRRRINDLESFKEGGVPDRGESMESGIFLNFYLSQRLPLLWKNIGTNCYKENDGLGATQRKQKTRRGGGMGEGEGG